MIDIFISRPTWIAEEFREGLTGFLSFLGTHDIKPRTLGSTDYPIESPLDEVIALMGECKGIIVLGYPQIYMTKGKIKDIEHSDLLLPTEWNHIEAALAYINKLPMLLIHHKGISRGVFDHGAISKFIHGKDLAKTNWFLSDDMTGALKRWKSTIAAPQPQKATEVNPLSPTTSSRTAHAKPLLKSPLSEGRLPEDVESVLVYLFNQPNDGQRSRGSIMRQFLCGEQAARYYLDALAQAKMVSYQGVLWSGDSYFSVTHKGREYVITNKLVSLRPRD